MLMRNAGRRDQGSGFRVQEKQVLTPDPRTRAFGFTLIELLVVVAIIAILAARASSHG